MVVVIVFFCIDYFIILPFNQFIIYHLFVQIFFLLFLFVIYYSSSSSIWIIIYSFYIILYIL